MCAYEVPPPSREVLTPEPPHTAPEQRGLDERDVDPSPFAQFARWYDEAQAGAVAMPDAMALATATPNGVPSVRMVLLKGFDERGFVFFSNYESQKGQELAANPRAAITFYWGPLRRQVRISGAVSRVTRAESEAYFRTRPLGSRLSASASPQSRVVPGRDVLEQRVAELMAQYPAGDVPLPPAWGGFRLAPESIEFWSSRPDRLHDRLRYTRQADGAWRIERLAP